MDNKTNDTFPVTGPDGRIASMMSVSRMLRSKDGAEEKVSKKKRRVAKMRATRKVL